MSTTVGEVSTRLSQLANDIYRARTLAALPVQLEELEAELEDLAGVEIDDECEDCSDYSGRMDAASQALCAIEEGGNADGTWTKDKVLDYLASLFAALDPQLGEGSKRNKGIALRRAAEFASAITLACRDNLGGVK